MSSWELWTRVAIAILIFGSLAVFFWFLGEVVSLARGRRRDRDESDGSRPPT